MYLNPARASMLPHEVRHFRLDCRCVLPTATRPRSLLAIGFQNYPENACIRTYIYIYVGIEVNTDIDIIYIYI